MSTTFRKCDQDVITTLFGRAPDKVMWLELSCRGIHFDVNRTIGGRRKASEIEKKHELGASSRAGTSTPGMRRLVARTLQQVEGSLTIGGYSMGGRSLGCHQNLNSYVEEKPLYFRVATRPAKVPYKVVTLVCRVVIPEFGWYAPLFTGEKKQSEFHTHIAPPKMQPPSCN